MPTRPASPCSVFGCKNTKPCPFHARKPWEGINPNRGKVAARGYGEAHRKWRTLVLRRDPFCTLRYYGCTRLSTVADHIVRISEGGLRFDLANGQGVCQHCHAIKSAKESR
jgi:5-methylcytosine-specific restriction protein A